MLFVSLQPDKTISIDMIRAHLSDALSKYKLPVEITMSMTFPRTPSARSTNRRCGGSSPKHVEALDSDPSHQRSPRTRWCITARKIDGTDRAQQRRLAADLSRAVL